MMFMEPWRADMFMEPVWWWCSSWRWFWAFVLYGGAHDPVDALDDCLILMIWWWWWSGCMMIGGVTCRCDEMQLMLPFAIDAKGEERFRWSMLLRGAGVVVINDKGGDCCCRLSLMPTPYWWLSLMPTTVMYSSPDGDPCSDHSMMQPLEMVEPYTLWWSPWSS